MKCLRILLACGAVCALAFWLRVPIAPVQAADPDYTIMLLPDTQYIVQACSPSIMNVMMNWIVANKNASQGGVFTTNLKAVIGLGDAAQTGSSGEYNLAKGSATSGYGILDANNIPFVQPPGNHDYVNPTTDHTVLSVGYTSPNGMFSADYRQAHGYFDNSTSFWGDKYDSANYYIRLAIGARKILVYSVEFQPRAAVMTWAKSVHDSYPGYENIFVSHSFLSCGTQLSRFSGESGWNGDNGDNGAFGIGTSQATSDANFNSGYAMWNSYLNAWGNLTMVLNGHFIATEPGYTSSPVDYHYQTLGLTSASSRAQTVQSIFTNWQDIDKADNQANASNEYPSWRNFSPDSAPSSTGSGDPWCANLGANNRMAHVFILQFRPSLGTVEGYAIATTNGRWEPTYANRFSHMSTTPVMLFSLPYTGVPSGTSASIGSGSALSPGAIVK